VRRNGDKQTVTVRARVPGRVDLVDIYTPMIEDEPDDPVLRYLRAQAQPSSEYDDAIDDLDHALEIDERFAEALDLRGEKNWTRSRDSSFSDDRRETYAREALQDWADALKFESKNTRALSSVAQANALVNQTETAKQTAQKALGIDERLPTAYYALGLSEIVAGRDAEAAEAARKAIELNPFDVRYYELLGRAFKRLDRIDDCQETLTAITGLINNAQDRASLLHTCI
jgi:tetratricopeptide (TPR) repeat protein